MSRGREVAGGGRAVEVEPERVEGWFDRFAARHGGIADISGTTTLTVQAADGAMAEAPVPYGELATPSIQALVAHLSTPRTIGLLLVRRGSHSVGIAEGGRVLVSRTDRHLVQGRSAAGGWSQQRFARRRAGQARHSLEAAADDAAAVLLPKIQDLQAIQLGGDHSALDTLRTDRRLNAVFAKALPKILDVPEPRRTVLDDAAQRARAVEIVIHEKID